ncbi:MAG: ParB N-terminal domain-containing protein [Oscillospiraceae bacterium]|nr:ParB N-terminal domain-containing protein [Oscillospiraceae bacterium]
MGFNLGASNNTGKLNMSDFLGDEATVQNDEKEIPINLLVPWENQPFKMYSDFKMNELVESIRENGLLSRIIVSPVTGGKYRIIAGHNRVEACRRAGFTAVTSIVKNVDENRAKLRRDSERKFTVEQANTLADLKFFSESDIEEICGEKTPVPEAAEERAEPAENSAPAEPKHNVKKPS